MENSIIGAKNRLLQILALYAPGAMTWRVRLHRWRGVNIGEDVFIGTGALLETSYPWLISIGSRVNIGVRTIVIAHFHLPKDLVQNPKTVKPTVYIEDDVYIGPGVIVLPNVTIGKGAVVSAGSVVTRNIPSLTLVRGNPAEPIARCGIPLRFLQANVDEFYLKLRPFRKKEPTGA
jgi:acetyltransferase-like isoleucine patch superfamily enzyme